MSELRIIPSRFAGTCPLCAGRWLAAQPIAPFSEHGEFPGRWGHPACVTADLMGLPSVESARERIAQIRETLEAKP